MNSPATLHPHCKDRETLIAADSCDYGLQGSIYQHIEETGQFVPIDHTSRALTPTEMAYSPLEKESLAQSWTMEQFRYYLVGSNFTAWTDHQPLVSIYNNQQKATSKRITKHRDAVQDLSYVMKYVEGKQMPCDFGSRHPKPIDHLSPKEQEKLGMDQGSEVYVRRLNIANSPNAATVEIIKEASERDTEILEAKRHLSRGTKPKNSIYGKIWEQLCVENGLLLKNDKIVIPNVEFGNINLQEQVLDIAHEGHPGAEAMKRYMRSSLWFPTLDKRVNELTNSCLPCQASIAVKHRDPLTPSTPPQHVWKDLGADHWGPTPEGKHILVVIDKLSRYPEVRIVKSTSAEDNIEAFDDIFTHYGYCDTITTDNGPPFNGRETHALQQYFKWAGIKHIPTESAEDPEANGLAEAFMKHLAKTWHTSLVEGKNPMAEINRHIQMCKATPHPTTGKSPAEMMFENRRYKTRLPYLQKEPSPFIQEARENERTQKDKQKMYKDMKPYVKPHNIKVGDMVLLSQKKTKKDPPYDFDPYMVTDVKGHQISATREDRSITRDAQKWKRFNPTRIRPDYTSVGTLDPPNINNSEQEEVDIIPNYTTEGSSDQEQEELETPEGSSDLEQEEMETFNPSPTEELEVLDSAPRRNPPRERKVPARYR